MVFHGMGFSQPFNILAAVVKSDRNPTVVQLRLPRLGFHVPLIARPGSVIKVFAVPALKRSFLAAFLKSSSRLAFDGGLVHWGSLCRNLAERTETGEMEDHTYGTKSLKTGAADIWT
jgi:hypothetical protein